MKSKPTYPLVHVEWVDASFTEGWLDKETSDRDNPEPPMECETAGFLIYESKTHIVVAHSTAPEVEKVDATMKIPRSAIRKIRKLRRAGS